MKKKYNYEIINETIFPKRGAHYYCYSLEYISTTTENIKTIYIGKSNAKDKTAFARPTEHIIGRKQPKNTKGNPVFYNKICQLVDSNIKITIRIIYASYDENEILTKEKELIKYYGRLINKTGCLYNITEGGEGLIGVNSKEIDQFDLTGNLIKSYTSIKEACFENNYKSTNAITRCISGKQEKYQGYFWAHKDEVPFPLREGYTKKRQKRTYSKEIYDKMVSPVDQYHLNGVFIKSYESAKQAGIDNNFITVSGITACCVGRQLTTHGFYWAYKGNIPYPLQENFKIERKKIDISEKTLDDIDIRFTKAVNQYDLDGNFIKRYQYGATEASIENIFHPASILDCCRRESKSAYNFLWTFDNQEPIVYEKEYIYVWNGLTKELIEKCPNVQYIKNKYKMAFETIVNNLNDQTMTNKNLVFTKKEKFPDIINKKEKKKKYNQGTK